jgi:hypothetical protein
MEIDAVRGRLTSVIEQRDQGREKALAMAGDVRVIP